MKIISQTAKSQYHFFTHIISDRQHRVIVNSLCSRLWCEAFLGLKKTEDIYTYRSYSMIIYDTHQKKISLMQWGTY